MTKITLKHLLKAIYPFVYFVQSIKHITRFAFISVFIGLFISFVSFYIFVLKDLPSPSVLSTQFIPQTTHIRDRNGNDLYKIYLNQNRTPVKLNDIPESAKQAILAIEDRNFYQHAGFSLKAILRALINDIGCTLNNTACPLQGGSTITQQLVKTSLLTSERTLQRKLRELVLSFAVEAIYTKDQILEMYLNRVSFGGAAYGIEEASQTYFGIPTGRLDLAQSAFIAGLPVSPTTLSPYGAHPELGKERQKEVLNHMLSAGFISDAEFASAAAEELVFRPPAADISAPHFVMYVKDLLAKKYGDTLVEQGGLDVLTSLDPDIQTKAEIIVTEELAKISKLHITNGAVLVTRPGTGEILAMVGSKDYFDIDHDGNVNVTLSARQPGSSIKPLNYSLAFQKGFSPASIIDDSPITYKTPGQPPYSPINYDNRYHGRITIRTALASSYNVPAVKILSSIGVDNLIAFAKIMGITTWDDPGRFGLSLTLGGGEVRMTDLATVYGVFANSGTKTNLNPILEIKDHDGKLLEQARSSNISAQVLDPKIAFLISDILSDNKARTPTFGPRSQLNIPGSVVAVKTGTTNNLRDNWTIGFTPDFLVSVWVGNNDNSPMSYVASGVTGASPIWRRITDLMLKSYPSPGFSPPSDLLKVLICQRTGQLPCSPCPGIWEYFLPGTQPKKACIDDQIQNPQGQNSPSRDRLLEGASTQR